MDLFSRFPRKRRNLWGTVHMQKTYDSSIPVILIQINSHPVNEMVILSENDQSAMYCLDGNGSYVT